MRVILSIGLAAVLLASPAAAQEDDPGALLGRLFCHAGNEGEKAVRYLLTRSLNAEIDKALAKNDVIAAANPDEKPPLGDGVPFQAYQDVAPECRVGSVATAGDVVHVDVEHRFPDTPAANWTDRLVVRTEDGLARIDDILYGPEKFELGLRDVLDTAFRGQ